jgi:mRNA-degrading endonuclease toxin of MazEF toxin-antitoxin module
LRRGETWWADLGSHRHLVQTGRRPVVIWQSDELTRVLESVLVVPLTTHLSRAHLAGTAIIEASEGGLAEDSVALAFQMRAIPKRVLSSRVRALTETELLELELATDPVRPLLPRLSGSRGCCGRDARSASARDLAGSGAAVTASIADGHIPSPGGSPDSPPPARDPWRAVGSGRPPMSWKEGPTTGKWSGREDLNLRPPGPEPGALPGCATPRTSAPTRRQAGRTR